MADFFDNITLFLPALGTLVIISLLTSGIGLFVISKKISLIGESISHAVLPGLALAYFLKLHEHSITLFLFALAFVLIYFLCIHFFETIYPDKKDSLFATLQVGFLALGALFFQFSPVPVQLTDIFLGQIFSISYNDLYFQILVALVLMTVFFINYKKFCLLFFDPQFYQVHLRSKNQTQFIFDIILSATLILSIQSVGSLLALGFLVIPSLIGLAFNKNLKTTMLLALSISLLSSFLGFYISYQWSWSTGPSIMALLFGLFIIISLLKKQRRG